MASQSSALLCFVQLKEGDTLNIGAKSGLVDPKHEEAMGQAVWLYLWFLWRQTKHSGLVLGGMPLTYKEIAKRSGFGERKIRRWLQILRVHGYVKVEYRNYMMMAIQVLKSKKFNFKQQVLRLTENGQGKEQFAKSGQGVVPKVVNGDTKNGQPKQSGIMIERESKAEEAAAAFSCIGFDEPFGQPPFQKIFLERMAKRNGDWLTITMEATIQECQRRKIGIPPQFYSAKRSVESSENAEAAAKYKRTPP